MIFLICPVVKADDEREAIKKASEALYKQSGLDKMVDEYSKKHTPELVKKHGGWILVLQQTVVHKQIKYEWTW